MIRYTLEGMDVSDVAVTRDLKWMVCVGSILDTESKPPSEEVGGMNQIIRKFAFDRTFPSSSRLPSVLPSDMHRGEVRFPPMFAHCAF